MFIVIEHLIVKNINTYKINKYILMYGFVVIVHLIVKFCLPSLYFKLIQIFIPFLPEVGLWYSSNVYSSYLVVSFRAQSNINIIREPGLTISHYHLKTIGTFYPETFTETYTEYIHSILLSSSSSSRPATILVFIFNLHICTLNAVCHFGY